MTYLRLTHEFLEKLGDIEVDLQKMGVNSFYDPDAPSDVLVVQLPHYYYKDSGQKFSLTSEEKEASFFVKPIIRLTNSPSLVCGKLQIKHQYVNGYLGRSFESSIDFYKDDSGDESQLIFKKSTFTSSADRTELADGAVDKLIDGYRFAVNNAFVALNYIANNSVYFEKIDRAERRRTQREMGLPKGDDYYELSLNQKKYPMGYSHPPGHKVRYHFVRGHYRQYEKHRTWIKPHWKGDKAIGVVHKDYAA